LLDVAVSSESLPLAVKTAIVIENRSKGKFQPADFIEQVQSKQRVRPRNTASSTGRAARHSRR
jgi:hypothetical protein